MPNKSMALTYQYRVRLYGAKVLQKYDLLAFDLLLLLQVKVMSVASVFFLKIYFWAFWPLIDSLSEEWDRK